MQEVNNCKNKFNTIQALLFDWDGVFHDGYKNSKGESSFSEADSMGMNLIRLAYYLKDGKIPYTAIVTGENNLTAFHLANREHFNAVFYKIKDKAIIKSHLETTENINASETLFVFDDVLDLSFAREVGIRFMVTRNASSILKEWAINQDLVDYATSNDGGNHAVREICEFVINELGLFDTTINTRIEYGTTYQTYLNLRQSILTNYYTIENKELIQVSSKK